MKILIFIALLLIVSALVTLFAAEDPGYVLITRTPWSVEMSLTTFAVLTVVSFAGLYLLLWLLKRLWNIPHGVTEWRLNRSTKKAREALTQGLVSLAEGNWSRAQSRLLSELQNSETPLINYLGAACASQALGNTEKRDEYIAKAQEVSPQDSLAIAMTQAHLYSWTEQHEQALATLSELRAREPKHAHILTLLVKTYLALRDWTSLADLIPNLRKNKVLSNEALDALELQVHSELLKLSLPSDSPELLKRAWNAVPKSLRQHPKLLAIYSAHLIKQNQMNEAETLLRDAIRRSWNEELVELYGRARADNPAAQLEVAESWLNGRPEDPVLLLTLGRLSRYNELWGKARSYLETSVNRRPTAETYWELGGLMEHLGEADKALEYYRHGLATLHATTVPSLPPSATRTPVRRQSATA